MDTINGTLKNKGIKFTHRTVTTSFQGQVSTAKWILEMTTSIQSASGYCLGSALVSFISSHPLCLSSVSRSYLLQFQAISKGSVDLTQIDC